METPTLHEIWKASQEHFQNDERFQSEIRKQFERMEPMVKAFENKKIARMEFEQDTKTITFYVKSALTVGALIVAILSAVKYFLIK